jgi:hypothetical protein
VTWVDKAVACGEESVFGHSGHAGSIGHEPPRIAGSAGSAVFAGGKDKQVNWQRFVASLVQSLAWPAGVLAVVIVLRKPSERRSAAGYGA